MTLRFTDGKTDRSYDDGDFPLAVALAGGGRLVLGPEAEAAPLARIRSRDGRYSIEPERSRVPLAHNGAALTEPAWLADGDRLTIGACDLRLAADADGLVLAARRRAGRRSGITLRNVVLALFLVLGLGAGFVLVASPVEIRITPAPEFLDVSGFPPPIPTAGRFLALPGTYVVVAGRTGYRVLRQKFSVRFGAAPVLDLQLQKLPDGPDDATTPSGGK